ncbi:polycomb protein eed-like [Artemia franciscana]
MGSRAVDDSSGEVASDDDTSSLHSFSTISSNDTKAVGKRKRKGSSKPPPKIGYVLKSSVTEDHGKSLFGVRFNDHLKDDSPKIFATAGSNRVTVYECCPSGAIKVICIFADPSPGPHAEEFFTCAWSFDKETGRPILAAAGEKGVIRVFSLATRKCIKNYIGHGTAINELQFHPLLTDVLMSVSKDYSIRLWNMRSDKLIAVLGGVDGHRSEAISADFSRDGRWIVSGGMDHSLKIWDIGSELMKGALWDSAKLNNKHYKTVQVNFPVFSTRDIHRNYVDCVRWIGDFVASKACENEIVLWKPGKINSSEIKGSQISKLHVLTVADCELWYIRFGLNVNNKVLALGNQFGKTYVWDLDIDNLMEAKHVLLSHPKCNTAVRQTAISRDGSVIICVCDDQTIWRWDKIKDEDDSVNDDSPDLLR